MIRFAACLALTFPFLLSIAVAAPSDTQGIYLNLSADAVLIDPVWKHEGNGTRNEEAIEKGTREDVIQGLNDYIASYAGSQVRGLFFNVNYQRACFDSKVMESYWDLQNPEKEITDWPRLHWAVKKKGIDPFEICIARCRIENISPWISIRMNDHHYFDDTTRINRMWLDHPEYRTHPPHGLFNYARQEVRDYYKAFIAETLDKYDVDGIELDWMRTHTIFPGGGEAEGMKLINRFMQDMRAMAKEKADERGHPIRIAVRVPATPDIGRRFGLDGVTWAKAGWCDMLIPSNWFTPTNFDIPVERWKREIGPEATCLVAAGADMMFCIAHNKHLKQMKANIETMRGFSVSALHRGADAIYIFNNFLSDYRLKSITPDGKVSYSNDKHQAMRELGRLSSSVGKPRTHVFTYTDPDIGRTTLHAPALSHGVPSEFKIHIGPKPGDGRCVIQVGLESRPGVENAQVSVTLNGTDCKAAGAVPREPRYRYDNTKVWHVVGHVSETGARVLAFHADIRAITAGHNRIRITNNQAEEQSLTWLQLHLE